MSASTVSNASPERMAPTQKPTAPKSTTATTPSLPGQFAALLLQADETWDTDTAAASMATTAATLVRPAADATESTNRSSERKPSDDDSQPGSEAALLGLLNWRNYATTPSTGGVTPGAPNGTWPPGASAQPPALSAANATGAPLTPSTDANGRSDSDLGSQVRGLWGDAQALTAQPMSNASLLAKPTGDSAAAGGMPPNTAAAQPQASPSNLVVMTNPSTETRSQALPNPVPAEGAATTAQPAKAGPVIAAAAGLEAPGPKAKPSAAKPALSAIQGAPSMVSTTATAAASTVSLAGKSAAAEPAMSARAAAPRAATGLSDAGATGPTDTADADGTAPSVTLASPADTPASATGSGSEGAGTGTDTGPASMPTGDAPQAAPHDSMEHTMERLSAQVSYWASQGSQKASLTIADELAGPLDVRISFDKGEVSVHFETDEEAVREALQSGAEDILNRLLEAKGMTLGSVSIGLGQHDSRQPPQQQQASSDAARSGSTLTQAGPTTGDAPAVTHRRAPDIISANKLDFFA